MNSYIKKFILGFVAMIFFAAAYFALLLLLFAIPKQEIFNDIFNVFVILLLSASTPIICYEVGDSIYNRFKSNKHL